MRGAENVKVEVYTGLGGSLKVFGDVADEPTADAVISEVLATTPPVAEGNPPSQELFFPHFADSGGYTTQFILFNGIVGRSVNGTLRFFSQSGQPLGLQLR